MHCTCNLKAPWALSPHLQEFRLYRQVESNDQREASFESMRSSVCPQTKHLPRENYGLFVEDPNVLGNASLFKMEQRLLRFGVLDRQLLATMTGSTGAEPRGFDPSGLNKRQAQLSAPPGVTPPVQAQLALGMSHQLLQCRGAILADTFMTPYCLQEISQRFRRVLRGRSQLPLLIP